jgi:DNA-directed RNA polymerase subunit E'/Rpb7
MDIIQNTIYSNTMLSEKILIPMYEINKNIKHLLETTLKHANEGKCITQGYVRPNSIKIVSFSSGTLKHDMVEYTVVYECQVCHPVEGMLVYCKVQSITKMGIHATVYDEETDTSPITVFIARDHQNTSHYFNQIKEKDKIIASIVGVNYELNDKCVYVSAVARAPPRVQAGGVDGAAAPRAAVVADDSEEEDAEVDTEEN